MFKRHLTAIAAVFATLALVAPARAGDPEIDAALAQLQAALPGELLNNPFTTKWGVEGNRIKGKIVALPDSPGGSAFEVPVRERFPEVWQARVTVPVEKDIAKGDEIEVAIWARADKPIAALGTGNMDLQIVRSEAPYDNVFSQNMRPGSEWKLLTARGIAGADYPAAKTLFGINIGYGKQTLQFGTVYILRLSTAEERANKAAETP
jgi:hypothetical protein